MKLNKLFLLLTSLTMLCSCGNVMNPEEPEEPYCGFEVETMIKDKANNYFYLKCELEEFYPVEVDNLVYNLYDVGDIYKVQISDEDMKTYYPENYSTFLDMMKEGK